jgi:ubiquinone/menaquinone biosynthesis C-methylase UbiE
MLPRVLEPEVMDSVEDAADYDAMDHSAVNRLFVADFLKVWNGRGPILDVGTGTAQIPIEFCRQSSTGDIVAIDLAGQMLALARSNVAKAGFESRIILEKINARELPHPSAVFPAVMSNSIVHHIPQPEAVIGEIARVAGPGATIFVRDLLRPHDLSTLNSLVEQYAGGDNDHQRRLFAESLHAALTVEETRDLVAGLGFDRSTVQQTSDRHWTWSARKS